MRKSYFSIFALLLVFLVAGAGCISISSKKSVDGGVYRSDDSAESWAQKVFVRQEKKDIIALNNVNVSTMQFHPDDENTIYLGTQTNGIWRTTNRGEKWDAFGITTGNYKTISIDPETPTIVYTASGSSIFKTSDDGENWSTIYLEPRGQEIVSVNVDAFNTARLIAATQDGQIIESIDYGVTWTTISPDPDSDSELDSDPELENGIKGKVKKLYVNTFDSNTVYAVTDVEGIFKSTNGGSTWALITQSFDENYPTAKQINWFTFTEKDPDIIYIATNYGILKSPDAGATWKPITTLFPFGSVPISTVAVNPDNHDEMYFTIGNIIHKTTDGSTTWKTINTFPSARTINYILVDNKAPEIIYMGTYAAKK